MNLSFSVATGDQADILSDFINQAYRGESSRRGWTTEADLLDGQRIDPQMVQEMIGPENKIFLVAYDEEKDHRMVGCVHLQKVANNECLLGTLTVLPEAQNRGVGRQLLEESEAVARSWECQNISMKVLASRRELIDWYCRRSYRLTGEKANFPYGDPRFGLPISKDLVFLLLKKSL